MPDLDREPTPDEYAECRQALEECSVALVREQKRTRSGVRTPAPGYENGYVSGSVHAAVCEERDDLERRWRRACELGDALARAADDLLGATQPVPAGKPQVMARLALVEAIRGYEEG